MENVLIKKMSWHAWECDYGSLGRKWAPGNTGDLKMHSSSGAQPTPQGTFTPLMSGLGRGQCGVDRLKRALCSVTHSTQL